MYIVFVCQNFSFVNPARECLAVSKTWLNNITSVPCGNLFVVHINNHRTTYYWATVLLKNLFPILQEAKQKDMSYAITIMIITTSMAQQLAAMHQKGIILASINFHWILRRWLLNPILAGESKEADSASSVSRFFVKKQSKEADSASFGCSIFFQIFFFENR